MVHGITSQKISSKKWDSTKISGGSSRKWTGVIISLHFDDVIADSRKWGIMICYCALLVNWVPDKSAAMAFTFDYEKRIQFYSKLLGLIE